ncbi:MAG: hypothetical protein IKO42_04385 [Opitutales bacterium]|nr:hypothetical protein [Opitutales bacterium]
MSSLPAALSEGAAQKKFVLIGFDPVSFESGSSSKKNFTKTKEFREYAGGNLVLARVRLTKTALSAGDIFYISINAFKEAPYKVSDRKNLEALKSLGMRGSGDFYIVAPNGKWAGYSNSSGKFSAEAFEIYLRRLFNNRNAPAPFISSAPVKKADYWSEDFQKAFADAKKRKKLVLLAFATPSSFSKIGILQSEDFNKFAPKNFECVAAEFVVEDFRSAKLSFPQNKNKEQNERLFGLYSRQAHAPTYLNGYFVFINPENGFAMGVSNVSRISDLQKSAEAFKKKKFEFYTITQKFPFYAVYWDDVKRAALESGKKIIIAKDQRNLDSRSAALSGEKFMGFLHAPCVFKNEEPLLYKSEMFNELDETPNGLCIYDPAKDEYDIIDLSRLDAYLKKF